MLWITLSESFITRWNGQIPWKIQHIYIYIYISVSICYICNVNSLVSVKKWICNLKSSSFRWPHWWIQAKYSFIYSVCYYLSLYSLKIVDKDTVCVCVYNLLLITDIDILPLGWNIEALFHLTPFTFPPL